MLINIILFLFFLTIIYGCLDSYTDKQEFLPKKITDSCKGIAAIMIVIAHIFSFRPELMNDVLLIGKETGRFIRIWGGYGVSLFFLLSGYGCWFSVNSFDANFYASALWAAKHIGKILIYYICSFLAVTVLLLTVYKISFSFRDIAHYLSSITIPGTLTWYLKIQMLFYVFIALSCLIRKHVNICITVLTLMYAIIAWHFGLSDFWWKTSMCFPVGFILANKRVFFREIIKYRIMVIFLIFVLRISIFNILNDINYSFCLQLILWPLLSLTTILLAQRLSVYNKILGLLGTVSLPLYLVHIGIVRYAMEIEGDFALTLFVITTCIGTFFSFFLSRKLLNGLRD